MRRPEIETACRRDGRRLTRLLAGAILLLGTSAVPAGAAVPARPFNVRGIPLGITLDQLRATPHPDKELRDKAHIVCASDPRGAGIEALRLSDAMLEVDVVKCGYFVPGVGNGEQRVAAPMEFFGEQVTPLFLLYRAADDSEFRLAQITFAMSNLRGQQLTNLFYRAYGNAPSISVTGVPTAFGAELPDIVYVWNNGVSSLHLDTLTLVLNQMSVVFTDNHLWGSLSDRLDTIARLNRIAGAEEARKRAAAKEAADALKAAAEDAAAADELIPGHGKFGASDKTGDGDRSGKDKTKAKDQAGDKGRQGRGAGRAGKACRRGRGEAAATTTGAGGSRRHETAARQRRCGATAATEFYRAADAAADGAQRIYVSIRRVAVRD
jgi:hypothetical protein